jgi:hypothetical protein
VQGSALRSEEAQESAQPVSHRRVVEDLPRGKKSQSKDDQKGTVRRSQRTGRVSCEVIGGMASLKQELFFIPSLYTRFL